MTDYLTPEELSRMTNEPIKRLTLWQSLGLIGAEQEGVFLERDIGRCRLIHDLLHYGIDVETIANTVVTRTQSSSTSSKRWGRAVLTNSIRSTRLLSAPGCRLIWCTGWCWRLASRTTARW